MPFQISYFMEFKTKNHTKFYINSLAKKNTPVGHGVKGVELQGDDPVRDLNNYNNLFRNKLHF